MEEESPKPNTPEFAVWVANKFIKRLINQFPNEDIEVIINRECKDWNINAKQIIQKVAGDMWMNNEI